MESIGPFLVVYLLVCALGYSQIPGFQVYPMFDLSLYHPLPSVGHYGHILEAPAHGTHSRENPAAWVCILGLSQPPGSLARHEIPVFFRPDHSTIKSALHEADKSASSVERRQLVLEIHCSTVSWEVPNKATSSVKPCFQMRHLFPYIYLHS